MPDKRQAHVMSGERIGVICEHEDCPPWNLLDEVHCGKAGGYYCAEHCDMPECVRKRGDQMPEVQRG
jgi:hypothetical protein